MRMIVIGGGIGGLTAAIAMGQAGIDAQLYEQAPELREAGAGIGLMGNALQALDALGLGDEVRAQSIGLAHAVLRQPNGRVLVATAGAGALAVMHRAELLGLLARRIERGRVHLGRTCVGFEQDAAGVTARFSNGEAAHGDGLIGADGLRSVIGTQLAGRRVVRYAGYTGWRAVVEFKTDAKRGAEETWGRGRRFGIIPMSRGRVYWFATNNATEGERDPRGGSRGLLAGLFRDWHEPIGALIAAAGEESILRNDIYDTDPLPNFVRGRAGLLGDAAHAMTPNLGQGACQAMEDGVVLAACLKKSADVPAGLVEYERRRMGRTRRCVLGSRWLGAVAQWENPVLCGVRDAAMRAMPERMAAGQMKWLTEYEVLAPAERVLRAGAN